jgi:hypothetical protein
MDEYVHALNRSFNECRAQGIIVGTVYMWLKKEEQNINRKTLNTDKQNDDTN